MVAKFQYIYHTYRFKTVIWVYDFDWFSKWLNFYYYYILYIDDNTTTLWIRDSVSLGHRLTSNTQSYSKQLSDAMERSSS